MNNGIDNTINTVKDLIEYLQTLNHNQTIHGEYLVMIGNQVIDTKSRPLLKDLIEIDFDGTYKFKPLIY